MAFPSCDRAYLYAETIFYEIVRQRDDERILKHLGEADPEFFCVKMDIFRPNYLCARLAILSHAWEKVVQESDIKDGEVAKVFLKKVMSSFEEPKAIGAATTFSEYFCAPQMQEESDELSDALAIAHVMFRRLQMKPVASEVKTINPSFQLLVEALESFRTTFENQVFEFLYREH